MDGVKNGRSKLPLERAQAFAGEIVTRQGATINDLEFYQKFSQQWS